MILENPLIVKKEDILKLKEIDPVVLAVLEATTPEVSWEQALMTMVWVLVKRNQEVLKILKQYLNNTDNEIKSIKEQMELEKA